MLRRLLKVALAVALISGSATIARDPRVAPWPYSPKQICCLVDNVYHEARGEPLAGQILVARVTINRSEEDDATLCTTVYKANQFSWTKKHKSINRQSDEYMLAWHAAYAAIGTTYAATYYHSIKIHPKWAKKFTKLDRVGNHIFYKVL